GFITAADAATARSKVVAQHRADRWPQHPTMTVGQWLESWYAAKLMAGTLRPTTARCYRQHLDAYLLPQLGGLRLCRLRGWDVTRMYAQIRSERDAAIARFEHQMLAATEQSTKAANSTAPSRRPRDLGPSSLIRLHATLHAALNAAVRAGEIPSNPAKQAEVPRSRQAKIRPWPPEIYGTFLDHLDQTQDRMAALFHLAGHIGLRRGELCGLRWEDVDLDNRVLVVRRQIADAGSQLVVSRPKTRSGEDRRVDLDGGTVEVLRIWRSRQEAECAKACVVGSGYVFTRVDGQHWHPAYLTHRFQCLTAAARLPRCRFHDLRHLAVSLQLAAGVDIAIVSKRLGHSTYTITADTYCHLLPTVGAHAAEATAALVTRHRSQPTA
ncbi:MAG: site-specific integrase, partial [Pseudonocardiaceae bacterium]